MRCKRYRFNPRIWKISWRRAWPPIPIFLPGESHGQGLHRVRHDWSNLACKHTWIPVSLLRFERYLFLKSVLEDCLDVCVSLHGSSAAYWVYHLPFMKLFSSSWVRLFSPFAHCHSDGAFKYYIQVLECVAFPFSRGSSQPRDRTQVSHIAGGIFSNWATREAPYTLSIYLKYFVQYC